MKVDSLGFPDIISSFPDFVAILEIYDFSKEL